MDDFNKLKQAVSLRDFVEENLTKSKNGFWCCPLCGSGSRETADSDGAFSIMPSGDKWRCFACDERGDIFDLAAIVYGIDAQDRKAQFEAVAEWSGNLSFIGRSMEVKPLKWIPVGEEPKEADKEELANVGEGRKMQAEYIRAAKKNIGDPDALAYLRTRGIGKEQAERLGIGYDAAKRMLVLPWRGCEWYHIGRYIDAAKGQQRHCKPPARLVGRQPIYAPDAASKEAFFIVEGVFDALAVELAGYNAIVAGTNQVSKAFAAEIASLVASRGGGVAVVMMDNDEGGRHGAEVAVSNLRSAGVETFIFRYPEGLGYGDPSEWYSAAPDEFSACLEDDYRLAVSLLEGKREEAYRGALKRLRVLNPTDVVADIFALEGCEDPIPTGFAELDKALGGGLRPGLIALGALSSMGKTTLSLQIADHIAKSGRAVLFVTIEQSARELVSKSVSRVLNETQDKWNAVSADAFTNRQKREAWCEGQEESFMQACMEYGASIAPKMHILEGNEQPSVADVKAVAQMIAAHEGEAPVIFIDYLQLLASPNDRYSDKQATDNNVKALRQIARDMRTPIWVISSLNRSSYSEGVTMDAWKESGAIEYGCDVLLGLQPFGLSERLDSTKEQKQKREANKAVLEHKTSSVRDCELVMLKNRNGAMPKNGIPLVFKPVCSRYIPCEFAPKREEAVIVL